MSTQVYDLSQEPQAPSKPPDYATSIFAQYAWEILNTQFTDQHRAWLQMKALEAQYVTAKTTWNQDYLNHNGVMPDNEPRPMPPTAINPDGSPMVGYVVCAELSDPKIPPPNTGGISASPITSTPTPWELQIYQMLAAIKAKLGA